MSPPLPARVDVLVVGCGPVGAALACLLGRYDVRTLVIDKSPSIFLAPRAIALDNEALRILQMAGLADDAFARIPIPFVRMRCPHVGEFATIDTAGTIDEHPKLATFYQPDLERALRSQVATMEHVTAASPVELVQFVDDGGGVRATVRTGDGVEHVVRARFLVGADGASSKVRAALGEDFGGRTYAEDWLIVDALGVPGDFDHVEFVCDPRRPTPHMVAPGGRTRWEFMLRPGETREEMEKDETLRRLLAPWVDPAKVTIERKAVYRFHARSCKSYSRGSVFLVGDAAHITPPFVGQGLVAGLRDAANLGWKLAWVVHGRAHVRILDSYDQERRPHAVKMIGLAKLMGAIIMPRSRVAATLVHGALKVARRMPALRGFLSGLEIKPKPRFAHGLFVRGRKSRLRRGDVLPQVPVLDPLGSVIRSDDVLGPSFALVATDTNIDARLSDVTRARWRALGGRVTPLTTALLPPDWCAVIRPDRTILHDGPIRDVDRVVREAIALLGADAHLISAAHPKDARAAAGSTRARPSCAGRRSRCRRS